MNDVFNEQLVVRQPNQKDLIKKIGIGIAGAALIFVSMMIPILANFFFVVVIAVGAGVVFLVRRYNIEYEYVFTNGELDIDRITNKSRRKRIVSVDVRSFETMVPVKGNAYEGEVSNFTKLHDFSSGVVNDETYAVIFEQGSERIKMIVEPNEQMFKAIRNFIPRKVKK